MNFLDEINAARVLEGDIHNDHVRFQVVDRLQSALIIFGFPADEQIVFLIDELRKTMPEDGMIIDNEDSVFFG